MNLKHPCSSVYFSVSSVWKQQQQQQTNPPALRWKDTDFGGGELVAQEVQVVLERLQVTGRRGQVLLQERLGLIDVVLQHHVGLGRRKRRGRKRRRERE